MLHTGKSLGPDGVIQTGDLHIRGIFIPGAPLAPLGGSKLGDDQALQDLHACVIINKVGGKAPDAHFLKSLTGGDKAFIIRWQGNVVLVKQRFVGNKTIHLCTQRQPVHAAVLIGEVFEVGIIDCTGFFGSG